SLSIVAGMAALVAIHALKATVESGIAAQAKTLLGSDLQVSSRQPFPQETVDRIGALAQGLSRETTISSMLYFPSADAARLVQVRALEGDYPFYGKVETTPEEAWSRFSSQSGILQGASRCLISSTSGSAILYGLARSNCRSSEHSAKGRPAAAGSPASRRKPISVGEIWNAAACLPGAASLSTGCISNWTAREKSCLA
ncbi:MAG: hypothetical protein V4710_23500, partial [Verrucomicrobiota bacterium]